LAVILRRAPGLCLEGSAWRASPGPAANPTFCFAAISRYFGPDAVYLVSPQADVCGAAALTDGSGGLAETGAGADEAAPSDQHLVPSRVPRRYQVRRSVLAALAIAVLVSVIVIERHTLAESLHVLANLNWAWFLLALASEVISLSSFGLSRRELMRVSGRPPSFGTVMAITYAGNALSISVPFAGAELALVFSYRQFRRHGVDAATTGWMLAVSAIFSTSALALLLVIGALAGSASLASAAGFLGAFVFIVPAAAVLLALRFESVRRLLHQVIAWLVGLSRSVLGVPAQGVDGLDAFLDRVASLRLPWPQYAEVFGLAVLNWVADCGALACAIKATGQPVPWHSLLLVYGAGAAVGSTGITPGGFALVELALTAALTAAGLPRSSALAAVLAYRLVNFWMILIGGWILMAMLAHQRIAPDTPGPGALREPAGHPGRIGRAGRPGIRSASGAGPPPRRRPGLLGAGPRCLACHRV
jgi:putative heme transporter